MDAPPPTEIIAGEVITVGFMVLSHGSPVSDARAYLSALHQETKETFRIDAVKDGAPGHFTAEAKFHETGTWFWEIVLSDWDISTTLAPITVMAPGAAKALDFGNPEIAFPAAIHQGTCDALGELAYPLEDIGYGAAPVEEPVGAASAAPAKSSLTEVSAGLTDILAGDHVIIITTPDDGETLACGEIGGVMTNGSLPFGLHGMNGFDFSGVAVLAEEAGVTTVTAYLTDSGDTPAAVATTGEAVQAEISQFVFSPNRIEIAAGDTITWTNRDDIAHTVTFEDMTLADSAPLDQGDSFSVTFDTPGTYAYQCNPHPDMRGTVVVK
jgi:plastocyanin